MWNGQKFYYKFLQNIDPVWICYYEASNQIKASVGNMNLLSVCLDMEKLTNASC